MKAFLVVLHVLVSLFLILFVLLQPGARGGVGAAFGGAGGQTVFGGRGANTFLAKLTAAAAVIFMLTSITLSYFGSSPSSVMARRAKATAASTDAPKEAPKEATAEDKKAEDAAAAPSADAAKAAADAPASPTPAAGSPAATAPGTGAAPASQPSTP
jgi:preprotein translocase subunit SecG